MTKRVDELELQIGEDDERLNWLNGAIDATNIKGILNITLDINK